MGCKVIRGESSALAVSPPTEEQKAKPEAASAMNGDSAARPAKKLKVPSAGPGAIKIFGVNDVYVTDHYAKLRDFVDEALEKEKPAAHFITHHGDFLSPAPLSNFDNGAHMVQAMKAVGFTHACLGNHEFDVPIMALKKRLNELSGSIKVLSSNIHFPKNPDGSCSFNTLSHDVVEVKDIGKTIGFLGYCTLETVDQLKSRGTFRKYDKVVFEDPLKVVERDLKTLQAKGVDFVVILTHLALKTDNKLASAVKAFGTGAVILGGHEHDPFNLCPEGIPVLKAGIDAEAVSVVTLQLGEQTEMGVAIESIKERVVTSKWASRVQTIHEEGVKKLSELGGTVLIETSKEEPLSSVNLRHQQSSVGQLFCDLVRRHYTADVCILNSGCIRNKKEYTDGMTLVDVQSEVPFKDKMYQIKMSQEELEKVLQYCNIERKGSGAYMCHCTRVTFDAKAGKLEVTPAETSKETKDDKTQEKSLNVCVPIALLNGMDNIEPLVKLGDAHGTKKVPSDSLLLLPDIVIRQCVIKRWEEMHLMMKEFVAADTNHDGKLTYEEFSNLIHTNAPKTGKVMIDLFFETLDKNSDKKISVQEYLYENHV